MRILSFDSGDVPEVLLVQVLAAQAEAWPAVGSVAVPATNHGHDPALDPTTMLLTDDEDVLAALDILRKQIHHGGESLRAAGLSTVVTPREKRGNGYGLRLVSAARAALAAGDCDLGMFTCDRPLQPFYERAGWDAIPGAVVQGGTPERPFPSDQPGFDKVTMASFFSARAIHCAPAFRNSRIALYPGDIDRLW